MGEITDLKLYEKVKKEIYNKFPVHSAYRSAKIVQTYKEEYYRKHKKMMLIQVKKIIMKA